MQEIRQTSAPPLLIESLTPREIDMLKCLAQGFLNEEIALQLNVSVRTMTTHVRNIHDKLHLVNLIQATLYAVEQGILPDPEE